MEIKILKGKNQKGLSVTVPLHSDDDVFCQTNNHKVYMHLIVWEYDNKDDYDCRLMIGDADDFYVEKNYDIKKEEENKIREIINWMKDHEYASITAFEAHNEKYFAKI